MKRLLEGEVKVRGEIPWIYEGGLTILGCSRYALAILYMAGVLAENC